MSARDATHRTLSRRRLVQMGMAAGAAGAGLAAPTASRAADVELKLVYHVWAGWEDALKAIIQGFQEQHPTIAVTYELVPFDELETTLTPRFAAKAPPDLVISNGGFPWAVQGLLLDLRDRISRDQVDVTKLADTLAIGRVLGHEEQLGLPVYLTGGLIFYNKTMLDAYGVAYPTQGWTMDDFRNAAITLTRDGSERSPAESGFDADDIAHYGVFFQGGQITEPFVRSFGGHFFNEDFTESLLTDPNTVAAYTFLHDLACGQHALLAPSQQTAATDPFVSQQAAIAVHGEWMTSLYQQIDDFDWDMAPPPQGTTGYPDGYHVYAASDTIGIASDSQHPDEAWEFIKYLCFEPSAQLQVAKSLGPALKEAAASPEFLALRTGVRGPSQENVTWAYKEMADHSALEFYLGTTRNRTKWAPLYEDFQLSLLTLCDKDLTALLEEYDAKITEALQAEA